MEELLETDISEYQLIQAVKLNGSLSGSVCDLHVALIISLQIIA